VSAVLYAVAAVDRGAEEAQPMSEPKATVRADITAAIVKRCCPDCCEHCYDTAVEAQRLGAGEYHRGKIEGAREMRERAAGVIGGCYGPWDIALPPERNIVAIRTALARAIHALPDEPEVGS